MPQLLLDFPLEGTDRFETFVSAPEFTVALAALNALGAGESLLLLGEEGVGKTHLLRAMVTRTLEHEGPGRAVLMDVPSLVRQLRSLDDPSGGVEEALAGFLARHEGVTLATVDGLEALAGEPLAQEAALYLFNRMRSAGGRFLCASRLAPVMIPGLREDLRNRLLWGGVARLEPPGDETLAAIIHKLAADRGVRMGQEVVRYLVTRLPRRVPALVLALEQLDRAALERQRPMTVPLAREVLGLSTG